MLRFTRSGLSLSVILFALLLPAQLSAQDAISVTPQSFTLQANVGTNVPTQTATVRKLKTGVVKWSVVPPDRSWLRVSPTSGQNNGTLSLSFPETLPAGSYQSSFRVVSGTTSIPVTVQLTMIAVAPTLVVGPQPSITCPTTGAADIWPGQSIQLAVDSNPDVTTFCLRAGVHQLTSSIRPQTNNTFVGEFGAILDGTGWTTTDDTAGAFRAHNEDIDYVTIRNLVIRNMPQRGIQAFYWMSDHWTIEYNEIAFNKYGIEFAPDFTIRHNYIHHNVGDPGQAAARGGGYVAQYAHNTTFDSNEIAYNGSEQKVGASANVTFRDNFVHHNVRDGIWYDSNTNAGALIEGNRVEDNGRVGISFEASIGATIRNNTLRRNAGDAVLISMSQDTQIYNNALEANVGGIEYFLNCASLSLGEDLKNNAAYDNTVVVGTQSDAYASGFSSTLCTSAQLGPYLNGSRNLTFSRNTYRVPITSGRYWLWGGWKYWNEWQALGHDLNGSVSQ